MHIYSRLLVKLFVDILYILSAFYLRFKVIMNISWFIKIYENICINIKVKFLTLD